MEEIKKKLLDMQQAIIDDIELDRDQSAASITGDIGDEFDRAAEDRSRELYQLLCERDQQKLKKIKLALDSIETKNYGVYHECGDKISKKRLMALPFTELCIVCKNEEERLKGIERIPSEVSTENYTGSDRGEL